MYFCFSVFTFEADCIAPGLEPALCPPHHAHDLAGVFAVEVGIGKGRQFTPPIWARLLALFSRRFALMQSLQVSWREPERVSLKSVIGRSSPHALHIFVSISLPP